MGEIIFNEKPAPGEYLAHHKYIRREGTRGHYRYYYPSELKKRGGYAFTGTSTEKGTAYGYNYGQDRFDVHHVKPQQRHRGITPNTKASYVIPSYMSETGRAFANAYSRVVSSAMIKAAKKNRHRGAYGKGPVGNAFLDRWIKRAVGKVNQRFIKSATNGYSKN